MKTRNKVALIVMSAIFCVGSFSAPVSAASYSATETKKVQSLQKTYHKLSQKVYTEQNLYKDQPLFNDPFNPGILTPAYITTSIQYINYYRNLCGLPNDANTNEINRNAQIGASSLAAVNAKTSLDAHGLIGYKRPSYISEKDWDIAESATLGNINFLESDNGATAGEIVTDLIRDDNNIAGQGNTGHRALILSARATRMGIGAAYGKNNGKFYSVENGLFADDILRTPVKQTVTFPSSGVFPYELLGKDTPWSAYFANIHISRKPKVYITDLTINKTVKATEVRNFGTDYYGSGYSAAITFKPGKLKIVNTHKYRVQISGVTSYSFRLFRQESTLKTPKPAKKNSTSHKKAAKKTVVKRTKK